MELSEKKVSSKKLFCGKILDLYLDEVEIQNGKIVNREVIKHKGAVCVVALTDDNNVYMVKQYRYPINKAILEVPAGKIDKGESHFETAKRELVEETGMIAYEYKFIGEIYVAPAYVDEIVYVYIAKNLKKSEQKLDEDEFLEVQLYHIDDLVDMILSGEIKDAKTQIALLKTKHFLMDNSI